MCEDDLHIVLAAAFLAAVAWSDTAGAVDIVVSVASDVAGVRKDLGLQPFGSYKLAVAVVEQETSLD